MQFFTVGSSKIEVFETCFYDIVTTQYDHPRYVKHVLARIYVVYTLFIPYFGCVLLGLDSLRGGLAEGNRITYEFTRIPLSATHTFALTPRLCAPGTP